MIAFVRSIKWETTVTYIDVLTVLEHMDPDEQADLYARLGYFAARRLQVRGPRARHYGFTAEELVNEALLRGMRGDRRCPEDLPLYVFFAGIIRSIVGHEADKLEHQVERVSLDVSGDSRPEEIPSNDDVEGLALAHVTLDEFENMIDDPVLLEYVALLAEDSGSSADEIAKRMGISVKAIYLLDRKLTRRRALWSPR